MAYLINRNPAARFECLYSLCKLINANYGTANTFSLGDVKYDEDTDNVHYYCTLLKDSEFGIRFCPYLQNPLSEAGCNMTNGVNCDSTKSKEVSNTINALHALGFVTRNGRNVKLTAFGKQFAETEYGTEDMQNIISKAVLNYGPAVGVLMQISELTQVGRTFNTTDIYVGYPNPEETVRYNGGFVIISAGSQADSNTRTKSCILAWLTAGGYIRPQNTEAVQAGEYAHKKYNDFINQPHRGIKTYVFVTDAAFLRNEPFETLRPLDYGNLTKMTAALRENNLADVRRATMEYEPVIQNRRLAILYFLQKAYENTKDLNFNNLIEFFERHEEYFVVDFSILREVIEDEIKIAYMSGIPFRIICEQDQILLHPLCGLNLEELKLGAPAEIVDLLRATRV